MPATRSCGRALRERGFRSRLPARKRKGLQLARDLKPHIVVINTANSHFSGGYLCRVLGRRLPGAQRLLLTERGAGEDIVLRTAAHPALYHPPICEKPSARWWRRPRLTFSRPGPSSWIRFHAVVNGPLGRHHLTPKQCDLLAIFIQRPNQVISRRELMEQIWKTDYLGDTRTLDVHIRWLREKIEAGPEQP